MAALTDALYCDEKQFDDLGEVDLGQECLDLDERPELFGFLEQDLEWEDDELKTLLAKEECGFGAEVSGDMELVAERKKAVDWIVKANCYFGFDSVTCVLAVNYFDRFLGCLRIRRDKPWMGQLTAVACLSLAAKVEETEVPLLVDLQVEESEYVFEAKTVQRIELLVLSTLQWKMNPVTPVCYFNHIFRRIGVRTNIHWEFLWRCEQLLLSLIADSRSMLFPPSVLATATMLYVIQEVEPCNSSKFQKQLMDVLKMSKEKVDECYKFVEDISSNGVLAHLNHKRKNDSTPSSPSGVIDMTFSESSNDSWAVMASTFISSSEPPFKRRAQDQLMRLH